MKISKTVLLSNKFTWYRIHQSILFTVLKIQRNVDIAGSEFKRETEGRLAEAVKEAFTRQKLIEEGKFQPLEKRRRKRYTAVGDIGVHVSCFLMKSMSVLSLLNT